MDSYILENSLDIVFFTPKMHHDDRGFFYEKFNKKTFSDIIQSDAEFVQQNVSFSKKNTLRGLHFQYPPFAETKVVYPPESLHGVLRAQNLPVALKRQGGNTD